MERIWGPVNGFYLAAYAAPAADGEGYCSYAKVCWKRPQSYWDADCAFKLFGGEHHRSLEEALGAVASDARNEAWLIPRHARSLAGRFRRYRMLVPRLRAAVSLRHRTA